AVPRLAAAADVPGHVELVAFGVHGRAVRPTEGGAVAVAVEGVEESDHLPLLRLGVELDDGGAVPLAAAVRPGGVVQVAPGRIDVDRGDVGGGAHRGVADLLGFFGLRVEGVDVRVVPLAALRHGVNVALRRLLGGRAEAQLGGDLDRRAAL